MLKRSLSTLSDELNRNKVKGKYDPKKADHKAYVRRKYARYQSMKIVSNNELRKFVTESLFDDQSPENISGRLKLEKNLPYVSKNCIYGFIKSPYGRKIEAKLKKRRKKSKYRVNCKVILADRKFINQRPQEINERQNIGDTEADFIVSGKEGKGVLLVITDRKIRTAFLELILKVTIKNVHKAFVRIKKRFPEMSSITTDNDLLLQKHKELEELLNVPIYFCHPYHSWEKGTVENTNKYIRKYIPKGSDLSRYSKKFICTVEAKLNGRFMKCLEHKTPHELLQNLRTQEKSCSD